ncbi:MAG: glycine cleavage system aminomethyltransferase GcvT, partial [Firmicutes bacterium]|nr:glycine cleavage system aminomethyltransferase GcvT [Bacillota bacterium]
MSEAKKTPLYEQHAAAKGNFIDYGGWFLPVTYQGIVEEVLHTRKKVSLFDASHMGEILVEGQKAEEFLQGVLTNDLSVLKNNGVMYSPICYPHGGTVDDILVYRYAQDRFLLVTNAVNTEKDYNFLKERYPESVVLEDLSAEFALIAIQGPLSLEILKKTMTEDVLPSSIRRYNFLPDVKIAGIKCLLSRTGYTGEDGFE